MISQAKLLKNNERGIEVEGYYFNAEIEKEHIIMKQVSCEEPFEYDNDEFEIDPKTLKHSFDNGKSWYSEEEIDKALTMMSALDRLKDR